MSEEKFCQINFAVKEETLERLKQSLPNRDQKKSGTAAITQAIDQAIAHFGAVVLDETLRKQIASRAGQPLPKTAEDFMACFEAATKVTPQTVHVDIDPGVASEIVGHAQGRGMTFQEMVKEIIEQSVVDRYVYSLSWRAMVFQPSDWKALTDLLGKAPGSSGQLVDAIKSLVSKAVRETREAAQDVPLAQPQESV